MEGWDSGQRTTALVIALWCALWMWRWFVQPTIVLFRGARPHGPPQRRPPPLRAHFHGGGRSASMWWLDHGQCRGSHVHHGVVPMLGQRDQEGEDKGADENRRGHGSQRSKGRGNRGRTERIQVGGSPFVHARTPDLVVA